MATETLFNSIFKDISILLFSAELSNERGKNSSPKIQMIQFILQLFRTSFQFIRVRLCFT